MTALALPFAQEGLIRATIYFLVVLLVLFIIWYGVTHLFPTIPEPAKVVIGLVLALVALLAALRIFNLV